MIGFLLRWIKFYKIKDLWEVYLLPAKLDGMKANLPEPAPALKYLYLLHSLHVLVGATWKVVYTFKFMYKILAISVLEPAEGAILGFSSLGLVTEIHKNLNKKDSVQLLKKTINKILLGVFTAAIKSWNDSR